MPLPEGYLIQVSQNEWDPLPVGTAASRTPDRKALMDGALDEMAAINTALADNARDDEAIVAAIARLDAAMCMGSDQDMRRTAVDRLDRWFFARLEDKSSPLLLPYQLRDDGTEGEDPECPLDYVLDPPIHQVKPDDVRCIRNGLWLTEHRVFRAVAGTGGGLPSRLPQGIMVLDGIDGEIKTA